MLLYQYNYKSIYIFPLGKTLCIQLIRKNIYTLQDIICTNNYPFTVLKNVVPVQPHKQSVRPQENFKYFEDHHLKKQLLLWNLDLIIPKQWTQAEEDDCTATGLVLADFLVSLPVVYKMPYPNKPLSYLSTIETPTCAIVQSMKGALPLAIMVTLDFKAFFFKHKQKKK